ncbi:Putative Holliday junction resolvase [Candidatus Johnevansia muelleri]|uniref:Putative pre-16S rRNA nuclease n=1 Tax=Candidatus Johnevansia muelleri TaxID=1495769 RepID=A0A078KBK2_9GAMM|nr:Putative Holliday junction resolvase [Candidatus Evansia muelleri]
MENKIKQFRLLNFNKLIGKRRIMSFDFGMSKIGIAIGNEVSKNITSIKTIIAKKGKPDINNITYLILKWKPDMFLIGIPKYKKNYKSKLIRIIKEFANFMKYYFSRPCKIINEFGSTLEAKSIAKERSNFFKCKYNKMDINSISAEVICYMFFEKIF